ncbi:MAG: hypothetical protein KO318_10990 [Methanobacterium sp.]|jgi:hypothetical protein|uniref:hypothetical protein n=1 Tax=Methanobacterium sp. TaxID=2164 RepID=UPI00258C7000|nr:hypothetical protein [Methanobacterium sp.]MCC7560931.1 hypothetical protein [Methanobacterium sp.]
MGLELINLNDEGIRDLMLNEIEIDISKENLYIGKQLKPGYENVYIDLLKESVSRGDCDSLANGIENNNCLLNEVPDRRTKTGMRKVPKDAHSKLAEGEFNRFFIRALCRKAIDDGFGLEIYRAKSVRNPRSTSERLIGQTVDPNQLLEDLRINPGKNTTSGIPGGPNSGLSVRRKN